MRRNSRKAFEANYGYSAHEVVEARQAAIDKAEAEGRQVPEHLRHPAGSRWPPVGRRSEAACRVQLPRDRAVTEQLLTGRRRLRAAVAAVRMAAPGNVLSAIRGLRAPDAGDPRGFMTSIMLEVYRKWAARRGQGGSARS